MAKGDQYIMHQYVGCFWNEVHVVARAVAAIISSIMVGIKRSAVMTAVSALK